MEPQGVSLRQGTGGSGLGQLRLEPFLPGLPLCPGDTGQEGQDFPLMKRVLLLAPSPCGYLSWTPLCPQPGLNPGDSGSAHERQA